LIRGGHRLAKKTRQTRTYLPGAPDGRKRAQGDDAGNAEGEIQLTLFP
jgi:hypothetical protein